MEAGISAVCRLGNRRYSRFGNRRYDFVNRPGIEASSSEMKVAFIHDLPASSILVTSM
jgi:hypothetical protein